MLTSISFRLTYDLLLFGTNNKTSIGANPNNSMPASTPKRPATKPTIPGSATLNGAPRLITVRTVPERPGSWEKAAALAMGYQPATLTLITQSAGMAGRIECVLRQAII